MADSHAQTGRCLCGKVRFSVERPVKQAAACHCTMCRRWGGGPLLAIHAESAVTFEGEEHVVRYKSSDWAKRGFCSVCGSNLFYFLPGTGEYILAVGALDDQAGMTMTSELFIDEKPDFYSFEQQTECLTGAEVFAKYVQSDASET